MRVFRHESTQSFENSDIFTAHLIGITVEDVFSKDIFVQLTSILIFHRYRRVSDNCVCTSLVKEIISCAHHK